MKLGQRFVQKSLVKLELKVEPVAEGRLSPELAFQFQATSVVDRQKQAELAIKWFQFREPHKSSIELVKLPRKAREVFSVKKDEHVSNKGLDRDFDLCPGPVLCVDLDGKHYFEVVPCGAEVDRVHGAKLL